MSENHERSDPSESYARAFSRIFWAFPFLAITAGPMISVGKEQIILDLLPDWLGFALIAWGAGRLMALHPGARMVRNLALVLNFLSIPLWVQYRRATGQAGNLTFWVMPLWPLASLVAVLGGFMSWKLCGIVADVAEWAGVDRTRRSAIARRGLGFIMAVFTAALMYILQFQPQWIMPALVFYLLCGLIVTCLMMGLMKQAQRICLEYEFADVETSAKCKCPGLVSRLFAVARIVLPLGLAPVAIWYYNDWQDAWREARSHEVKGREHGKVAQAFRDHVKSNRLDEAYDLTTPNFNERQSRDDFKALIRRYDGLKEGISGTHWAWPTTAMVIFRAP
jgi:hypothetical protein